MRAVANEAGNRVYVFEGFTLDAAKRLVFDPQGTPVPLMPKAFEILLYLVTNSQTVVDKDELMAAVWPDTIVEENNLTQNISAVRKALGEKHRENRFIATVPGRGYKFVAGVNESRVGTSTSVADVLLGAPARDDPVRKRPLLIASAVLLLVGLVSVGFVFWTARSESEVMQIRSVAVLPFKPLASDRRDESLELGMADTLIMKLGSDELVAVRPLSSVRRFTALDQDPIAAGKMVNVDAVLEGSIQTADDRIRVSVKLLRVADSKQIWSGKFDEKLTDIFTVQDSIARRVAEALNIRLGRSAEKSLTENVEAYQLYMRGKLHARRLVRSEVEKGIGYYEEALKIDPKFAQVYVEIAIAYRALILTGDSPPLEMMPKAKAAVDKALELDDTLAEAWSSRAVCDFWYDWNWRAAEANHLRAIELDPYSLQSRLFYAHLLSNLGRHDEALEQVRKARERDPVSLLANAIEGQVLFFAGQNETSAKVLNSTIDMDPNFWLAHLFISRVHLRNGDYDQMVRSAERAAELSGGNAEALATAAYGHARAGRPAEVRRILTELESRAKSRYVPSYAFAQVYAGLGDRESVLYQLEKAFTERDALMVFLKIDPKWDEFRTDPRFIELMKKMNF